MWLIVYVDLVFLVNMLISFTFLLLIKFLVNGKESVKIILFCSFLSVLLLFSFFLDKVFYILFKLFGGLIVLSFTLIKTHILEKMLRLVLYYSMQFCLVGLTNAFYVQGIVLIICIFILIVCFILYKYRKLISKKNIFERKIQFVVNNHIYKINGYLDSGNLSTYKGNAIIYLDNKYLYLKKYLDKEKTNINTINDEFQKDIYYLKEMIIENKKYKDIYISFGNLNGFECLLNVMMA